MGCSGFMKSQARTDCDTAVPQWRAEKDLAKKAVLYRDMSPDCQKVADQPAPAEPTPAPPAEPATPEPPATPA